MRLSKSRRNCSNKVLDIFLRQLTITRGRSLTEGTLHAVAPLLFQTTDCMVAEQIPVCGGEGRPDLAQGTDGDAWPAEVDTNHT